MMEKELIIYGLLFAAIYFGGFYLYFREAEYTRTTRRVLGIVSALVGMFVVLWEVLVRNAPVMTVIGYECVACMCVPIAYIDWKKQIIPNKLVLVLLLQCVVMTILRFACYPDTAFAAMVMSMLGLLVCGGILVIGRLLSRSGVGGGDVKIFLAIGYLLGFDCGINILLFTLIISAITGLILIVTKKKSSKDLVPMGPFILIGTMLAVLLGA